MEPKLKNRHDTTEGWSRAAWQVVAQHFADCGHPLPDSVKVTVAFGSRGRKAKMAGEYLPPDIAGGVHYVTVRPDKDDALEIMGIMAHEAVHILAGPDHKRAFKDVAAAVGMDASSNGAVLAMPNRMLREKLDRAAKDLAPLPHTRIDFEKLDALRSDESEEKRAADVSKKQDARNWKCSCEICGYRVSASKKWVKLGTPWCGQDFNHGRMSPDPDLIKEIEADQARAAPLALQAAE
jgi:hypothetical protein